MAEGKPAQADAFIFSTSNGGALRNWDRGTKRLIMVSALGAKDPKTGSIAMSDGASRWCQTALNIDPRSASKIDPSGVASLCR